MCVCSAEICLSETSRPSVTPCMVSIGKQWWAWLMPSRPSVPFILKYSGSITHIFQNGTLKLTHWGRVTHICVSKLTIIGSDYGLSPGRRQAIIWTNAGILLIRTLGTNFSEILNSCIFIQENAFENVVCEMASICLGLNVLNIAIVTLPDTVLTWCHWKEKHNTS